MTRGFCPSLDDLWGSGQQRFRSLPYELQVYLAGHEKRRETVVRRSQNEAAAARRELAELKSKEVT
jgi:hypothetical protein